jgi:pimeloyl-ACP methyl ester carboxylesterase
MKQFKTNLKGGSINYFMHGKGDTLILLHGYCEDSSIWFDTAKKLAANNTIVMIDLPGFGKSSLFRKDYNMSDLAEMVLHLASELHLSSFHLMGHSMGGYIALEVATKEPEKIKSIGLIHSHCFTDSDDKIANRKKAIDFIKKHGTQFFLQEFYTNLFAEKNIQPFTQEILDMRKRYKDISAEAIIQGAKAMIKREDRSDTLRKINCPVFMFCGKEDAAVSYNLSLIMASIPKFCDFHLLESVGHVGFIEAKGRWIKAIKGFLNIVR